MDRLGGEFGAYRAGQEFDDFGDDEGAYDDGAHSNPPPSPVGQDERRMQVRAYNHWASLLGNQGLPHIEDLEPEFLGDFGPYSALFDFSTGSGTPTIQFVGDALSRECRELDPIETLQEIPEGSLLSKIAEQYLKVVSAQSPVAFAAESPNARGQIVAYRGVLLPYSSDHDTIDFVYAVINWKEVADAQTADALLEEIDRAMDFGLASHQPDVEAAPAPTADIVHFDACAQQVDGEEPMEGFSSDDAGDPWDSDDNILELRGTALGSSPAFSDLTSPSFGHGAPSSSEGPEEHSANHYEEIGTNDPSIYAPAADEPEEAMNQETPFTYEAPARRNRLTDALGNPIGGAPSDDEEEAPAPGGITTAADYGLPDWDEDEPEEEDVDDLVNPLADIDLNSRLLSLVNAGTRGKKTVDLATLSDVPEPEEALECDAEKLFRAKAPSVDSLLSPEPYSEDDGAVENLHAEYADTYEEGPVTGSGYEYASEAVEEAFDEVEAFAEAPFELAELAGDLDETEAPYELTEQAVVEEYLDAPQVFEVEKIEPAPHPEWVQVAEEPFDLGEELVLAEEAAPVANEEFETVADGDASVIEPFVTVEKTAGPEQELAITESAEHDGLTGLLAAVRDLSEAARTTEDLGRRALYEAVGRAFDVSIKAVIASEHQGLASRGVVKHFPLEDVARDGPDMALVMVRRHANGETEVLGEVPHDIALMESAQRKLASQ